MTKKEDIYSILRSVYIFLNFLIVCIQKENKHIFIIRYYFQVFFNQTKF